MKRLLRVILTMTMLAISADGIVFARQRDDIKIQKDEGIQLKAVYRTQEEIKDYLAGSNIPGSDLIEYAVSPVLETPYEAGKLSDETLRSALDYLNSIRFIAGLESNVGLNDEYSQ